MAEQSHELSPEKLKAGLDCLGVWRPSAGASEITLTRGSDGLLHLKQVLARGGVVTGIMLRVGSALPSPNCWTWEGKLCNGVVMRMKIDTRHLKISSRSSAGSDWSVPDTAVRIAPPEAVPEMAQAADVKVTASTLHTCVAAIRSSLREAAFEEERREGAFNLKWQRSYPSKAVFQRQRIQELTALLNKKSGIDESTSQSSASRGAIQHVPIPAGSDVMHPLSFGEEHMMQLYVSDPYNLSYNLPAIVQLPVHLDVREVEHVIDIFTQRHTVFRSAYRYGPRNDPRRPLYASFPGTVLKVTVNRKEDAMRLLQMELSKPVQLGVMAARFMIITCEGCRPWIIGNFHHILVDNDCLAIASEELTAIALCVHAGFSEKEMNAELLPQLPISFVDFAYWHQDLARKHALQEDIAWCYYNVVTSTPPLVLDLPIDRPRPRTFIATGSALRMHVSHENLAPMLEFGATQFGIVLAAWGACLSRVTGREHICVGIPFALKPQHSLQHVVGNFLNMLPVRIRFDPTQNYNEYVREVGRAALGVQKHALAPFMSLVSNVQKSLDPSRNPMYQTMVDMVPVHDPESDQPSQGLSGVMDLFLFVGTHNGNVCCVDAVFNSMLLKPTTVRKILLQMKQILHHTALHPRVPLPLHFGSREPVQVSRDVEFCDVRVKTKDNSEYTVKVCDGFRLQADKDAPQDAEGLNSHPPVAKFIQASGLAHVGTGATSSSSSGGKPSEGHEAVNTKEFRIRDDGKAYRFDEYLEFFGDPDIAKASWFRCKVVVDSAGKPREDVKKRRPGKVARAPIA
mmetsp:Transcript_48072/g.112356  ORF Transcript_48072/g.112356 Transcript_48072/m.112356 type:complete len:797 (-) Transcript_48072:73-2463(-)